MRDLTLMVTLPTLPTNIRLGYKRMTVPNTLAYYDVAQNTTIKSFILQAPGACIIKLITAVINGFRNKLDCLSLSTKLGLPGTNTLAYYGNRKLRP